MTRRRYDPGHYAVRVGRSPTGRGLFALEEISKGACVIEYTGRVVSEAEANRVGGKYLFEINSRRTILGNVRSNVARNINHSCRPNCEPITHRDRVFIFAKKRVKAGEELTYNYGKEYVDQYIRPHGCRCEKCRP
jgi:SET domain-containing protein